MIAGPIQSAATEDSSPFSGEADLLGIGLLALMTVVTFRISWSRWTGKTPEARAAFQAVPVDAHIYALRSETADALRQDVEVWRNLVITTIGLPIFVIGFRWIVRGASMENDFLAGLGLVMMVLACAVVFAVACVYAYGPDLPQYYSTPPWLRKQRLAERRLVAYRLNNFERRKKPISEDWWIPWWAHERYR